MKKVMFMVAVVMMVILSSCKCSDFGDMYSSERMYTFKNEASGQVLRNLTHVELDSCKWALEHGNKCNDYHYLDLGIDWNEVSDSWH